MIGDNSLTPAEQREALYRVHMTAIRNRRAQIEGLKDQLKAVNKLYAKERNAFKHDLDIELELLDIVLKKSELSRGDLVKSAVDYNWLHEMEGLPVGGQMSLITAFENTPAEVKDAIDFESDGYRAGVRGADPNPPSEVPPRFHSEWMKGWHNGQERNAWAMAAKGKIVDRAENPDFMPRPVDHSEPDDDEGAPEEDERG